MNITLINIKTNKQPHIFIGRGSVFGNPYKLGMDGDRHNVIRLYNRLFLQDWIEYGPKRIALTAIICRSIKEHKNTLTFGCYCNPKPCHGDIIIERAQYLYNYIIENSRS